MNTLTHPRRDQLVSQRDSTIRQLRLSLGITQNELAIQAGVCRHSVIRQEQLCYPTPLPAIVSLLSDAIGTSESLIIEHYLSDVHSNRAYTALSVFDNPDHLIGLAGKVSAERIMHPFQQWRTWVCLDQDLPTSRIHFSQLTSIHPATLFKYEAFKTGFPAPVLIAFKEMGLPDSLLNIFKEPVFNIIR